VGFLQLNGNKEDHCTYLIQNFQSNYIRLIQEDYVLIWSKNPNGDYTTSLGYSSSFLENEKGEQIWW
jgi:hypothetical protein